MATTLNGAENIEWDLSDLFLGPDDPRLTSEMESAANEADAFHAKYYGKVAQLTAQDLAEAIKGMESLSGRLARVGIFASLRYSTDNADPARGAALAAFQQAATAISTKILFFELEWVGVDDARANDLIADKALANYKHYLENARLEKPYLLTEAEEKIMAEKSLSGRSAWARLFGDLTAAIRCNVNGQEVGLEQAFSLLSQPDRETRQTAFKAITDSLDSGLRTRAFIFNTLLADKMTDDRLRSYETWITSRNKSNEASDEAVQALVDAVVARYDLPQRYYKLKAKILGITDFSDFDRSAPVSSEHSIVDWEGARSLVVGAYEAFSPKAGNIVDNFFANNWIDAKAGPAKRTGAFCMTTCPGVHPYVFMTYTGERRSVLTLAHELGHAMHGTLASSQTYMNQSTPLTLAETASVFGESLVFGALKAGASSDAEKLDLLTGRIDDAIGTVFRQISMNRFEDAVHNERRDVGELGVDRISELWMKTQTHLYGDSVKLGEGYAKGWSYIPHFIGTPGYVYAYSFGFLFSLAIYNKYVAEGESMVEPYFELLASGGGKRPDELAQIVGLDITKPTFWASALAGLEAEISEAEKLAGIA